MGPLKDSKGGWLLRFPVWFRGTCIAPWILLTGACGSAPVSESALPAQPAPAACGANFARTADTLTLPPAESAPAQSGGKGSPLKIASAFPVGGGVRDVGRWQEATPGWQSWRLRLTSEGASSLSLHLHPFVLPDGGALWICAPQNRRQGPYTLSGPSGRGSLWTPQVKGSEIWVELLVPEASRNIVQLKIAEAFAGYR